MEILILKTNIDSNYDFLSVKGRLNKSYNLKECTIDLEDRDKVLRIIGNNLILKEITARINGFGFVCEELAD